MSSINIFNCLILRLFLFFIQSRNPELEREPLFSKAELSIGEGDSGGWESERVQYAYREI